VNQGRLARSSRCLENRIFFRVAGFAEGPWRCVPGQNPRGWGRRGFAGFPSLLGWIPGSRRPRPRTAASASSPGIPSADSPRPLGPAEAGAFRCVGEADSQVGGVRASVAIRMQPDLLGPFAQAGAYPLRRGPASGHVGFQAGHLAADHLGHEGAERGAPGGIEAVLGIVVGGVQGSGQAGKAALTESQEGVQGPAKQAWR